MAADDSSWAAGESMGVGMSHDRTDTIRLPPDVSRVELKQRT